MLSYYQRGARTPHPDDTQALLRNITMFLSDTGLFRSGDDMLPEAVIFASLTLNGFLSGVCNR